MPWLQIIYYDRIFLKWKLDNPADIRQRNADPN